MDEGKARVYDVAVSELPEGARIGDVFEVEVTWDGQLKLLENLPDDRDQRLAANRLKREKLLRRKK